jgi:hypothetical protein
MYLWTSGLLFELSHHKIRICNLFYLTKTKDYALRRWVKYQQNSFKERIFVFLRDRLVATAVLWTSREPYNVCSDSLNVIPEGKGLTNGITRQQIQVKTWSRHADEIPCPGLCRQYWTYLRTSRSGFLCAQNICINNTWMAHCPSGNIS